MRFSSPKASNSVALESCKSSSIEGVAPEVQERRSDLGAQINQAEYYGAVLAPGLKRSIFKERDSNCAFQEIQILEERFRLHEDLGAGIEGSEARRSLLTKFRGFFRETLRLKKDTNYEDVSFNNRNSRNIRRVSVIGIHGWAPLHGVLSQDPLIASTKLAKGITAELKEFNAIYEQNVQFEYHEIPLHGHGTIENRVKMIMRDQIPPHQKGLQESDVIIVVGHSQGAIVATLLLHELMFEGWINTEKTKNIGFVSVAGIHHGPFPDSASDFYIHTRELFLLSQPYSPISLRQKSCLQDLMACGTRCIYFGSWLDQVVPLYSSTYHGMYSNNMLRALFVHESNFSDKFLVQLVALLLFLRNSGIENDLLVHISGFIRSSILSLKPTVNGGFHSAVHYEKQVYRTAIEWIFSDQKFISESKSTSKTSLSSIYMTRSSVYWSEKFSDSFMHSPLNRYFIRKEFISLVALSMNDTDVAKVIHKELIILRELILHWNPHSKGFKALRDILLPLLHAGNDIIPETSESNISKIPFMSIKPPERIRSRF